MGRHLRREIEGAPVGSELERLQREQIAEIQSIPRAAAEHVRHLANEAMITGGRSVEIAKHLQGTLGLTEARARMVARAAVNGASTSLMEVRAKSVGSEGYIWRSSDDGDVRNDHKRLNGKFIRWSEPPVVDLRTGYRSHAGCNAGCRCWPEVVLPEEIE
jgi:SPP1 gp7 family putative phage head morphogenesis protein